MSPYGIFESTVVFAAVAAGGVQALRTLAPGAFDRLMAWRHKRSAVRAQGAPACSECSRCGGCTLAAMRDPPEADLPPGNIGNGV